MNTLLSAMDITVLMFLTVLGFICILLGVLLKKTGLGTGLNAISMMIFILIGLLFLNDEPVTLVLSSGTVTNISTGLSKDHLTIVYVFLALVAFYAEF